MFNIARTITNAAALEYLVAWNAESGVTCSVDQLEAKAFKTDKGAQWAIDQARDRDPASSWSIVPAPRDGDQAPRVDVYQQVTDTIVATLEAGTKPWECSWKSNGVPGAMAMPIRHNGEPYNGMNVLLLWARRQEMQFNSVQWMTFKQARELGGSVRKGERGAIVVYADKIIKKEEVNGSEETKAIPFMKAYRVFNVDQIDCLPERFYVRQAPAPLTIEGQIERAERLIRHSLADIRHGGNRAFFRPSLDYIQMPMFHQFKAPEFYYATLLHELTHWTGHESRLDRTKGKRFGDTAYAFEELVAELGAAFLCAQLGIDNHPVDDHASYIAGWLKALKNDKRMIFAAASLAQKAADYLVDRDTVEVPGEAPIAAPIVLEAPVLAAPIAAEKKLSNRPPSEDGRHWVAKKPVPRKRKVKALYPYPVFEAHYIDGETVRASFMSPAGEPLDLAHGRSVCDRIYAGIAWRKSAKRVKAWEGLDQHLAREAAFRAGFRPQLVAAFVEHPTEGRSELDLGIKIAA